MKKLMSFLAALIIYAGFCFSQTTIADKTNVSGTWTKSGSPYIVNGLATVPQGSTLTIEPGVEVRFRTGTDNNYSDNIADVGTLYVKGKLIAEGTANERIIFTRNENSGNWGCIGFHKDSQISSLINFEVRFASQANQLEADTYSGAISVLSKGLTVKHALIKDNLFDGIYCSYSNPKISNNIIANNGRSGIRIWSSFNYMDTIRIINNTIINNTSNGIQCANATTRIVNNIIWKNQQSFDITNNKAVISNCLVQEDSFIYWTLITKGGIIYNTDPILDENFTLKNNSPCINSGTSDTLGLNLGIADIFGNNRLALGRIDIGAAESSSNRYLSITYPKGREGFQTGREVDIRWKSNAANIKLEYTVNAGTSWNTISASTLNDGSFKWNIPSVETTAFNIRATDIDDNSIYDQCDLNITVFASIIPDSTRLSGRLTLAYSPYTINGYALILPDDSLIVDPGVIVKFKTGDDFNYYSDKKVNVGLLYIKGKLIAEGNASQKIIFTRDGSSGFWGCLAFPDVASKVSRLSFCRIEYANQVQNLDNYSYSGAIAAYCPKIEIRNSEISNNNYTGFFTDECTPVFNNNIVALNLGSGININSEFNSNDTIKIVNNTFYGNKLAGMESRWAKSKVINCIFWQNQSSLSVVNDYAYVSYSLVQEDKLPLSLGWMKPGIGIIYNLNPQINNEQVLDFHLKPTSPGMDTGDPKFQFSNEPHTNGGRIDMGAYGNTSEATISQGFPSITYLSKRAGRMFGMDTLKISGNNLLSYRGTGKVKIYGTEVTSYLKWQDDTIICVTAPHKNGDFGIYITNNDNKTGFAPACYKVLPPLIDKLNPLFTGTTGNISVKFSGTLFGRTRNSNRIFFDSNEAGSYSQWTDSVVILTNPPNSAGLADIKLFANDSVYYTYKKSFLYTDEVVTELCGTLPDLLQRSKTYLLTCPVTVASGKTLTIEPDVTILVQHKKGAEISLTADGDVFANGTLSEPVRFISIPQYPGYWKGILLNKNGTFSYSTISDAMDGLTHRSGTLTLSNSVLSANTGAGLKLSGDESYSTANIEKCTFSGNRNGIDAYADCNQTGGSVVMNINNSDLSGNSESGLKAYSTGSTSGYSVPISRGSSITVNLKNSIIMENKMNAIVLESFGYIDDDYIPSAHRYGNVTLKADNSIIYNNGYGIRALRKNTTHCTMKLRLENTLLYNNKSTIEMDADEMFIYNSSLWDNGASTDITGFASNFIVKHSNLNNNSFPADDKNLSLNPLFAAPSSGDFHLLPSSPLIDKGSNDYITLTSDFEGNARTIDGDGNGLPVTDIGPFEFGSPVLSTDPSSVSLHYSAGSNATINVTSNLLWTASSNQSWLTLSSATGSANGMLTVTASANNVTSPRTATVTISGGGNIAKTIIVNQAALSTGMDDVTEQEILVYPNPVIDKLNISLAKSYPGVRLSIYSSTGTLVFSSELSEITNEIDLTNIRAGIYLMRIITSERVLLTRKFIKE